MKNKRSFLHGLGTKLIQSAVLLGCTGLVYVQVSGFPSAASTTSDVSQKPADAQRSDSEVNYLENANINIADLAKEHSGSFLPIDGSLPLDGDYENAMLHVLNSRPLYDLEEANMPYTITSESPSTAVISHSSYSDNWNELENQLITLTDSYRGTWSIYVKDLASEASFSINDKPMEAASLIKLYIMGAVFDQIQQGNLKETDKINRLLTEMITISDNEAANELVRYLSPDHKHEEGLKQVNTFIQNNAFSDTIQNNGLSDKDLWYSSSVNQTSVSDCGRLLEEIYNGSLVSHLASRKMENLLLNQEITYKIPAVLPNETSSASKTGEVSGTENDTAIIYSKGGDFILCIMSTDWNNQGDAINQIHEITKTVYQFFNPETQEEIKISQAEN